VFSILSLGFGRAKSAEKGYSFSFINRTHSMTAMNISQKTTLGLFLIPISMAWGAEGVPKAFDKIYLGSRPSIAPDNKQFVFEWCENVWIASTKGGEARALQAGTSKDVWPVFAPDGQRIVFQSDRDGNGKLFELNLASGKTRQLTFHSEGTLPCAWTKDGNALLSIVTRDQGSGKFADRIALIPARERGPEKILFDTAGSEPALSPDGTRVLFTIEGHELYRKGSRGSNVSQVWLYHLSEKTFTCMVKRDTESRTPLWTPDGKGFYYVSGEDGCMNIRHRLLATGEEKQLTFFKDDAVIHPTLSQDGRLMIFRNLFDFYSMDPTKTKPAPEKINLQHSAATLRPESRRRHYNACWNNDQAGDVAFCDNGMQIAFTTGGDLWVMDTVLRDPKLVHGNTLTHERECVFSLDGSALYYLSDRGDGVALWKAERTDTTKFWWQNDLFHKTLLVQPDVNRSRLSLSPDGKRLAWVEPCGNIVIADTNGIVLTRCPKAWGVDKYEWSPDGKWLVASLGDDYSNNDIWLLPTNGQGKPYNLSRHFSWDGRPCWSPDGKIIAFVGQRPQNDTALFYVWLNREDEERNTFDKTVESALSTMRKETASDRKESDSKSEQKNASSTNNVINFDDLYLRVRRVNLPNIIPSNPFFSHDSRTLAFEATINGAAGTYKIVLPERTSPELLTQRQGQAIKWLAKDNRLLWKSGNLPAHFDRTFSISVYQETNLNDYQELAFLSAWGKLRDWFYDPNYHGADWKAVKDKYRLAARYAPSFPVFARVLSLMEGELNASHLGYRASDHSKREWDKTNPFQSWTTVTAHLGLQFDPEHTGKGWKIKQVIQDSPAAQVALNLLPGDLVLSIDGESVTSDTDPTLVLNGPENRKIRLAVQSGSNTVRTLILPSTSFSAIREKMKTVAFEKTREHVQQASNGKLGYINIQRMQWDDYYRFEQDIFAEGFDKEGLIIDVRDNTGGFVADRILGVLCGSVHSIAVGRDSLPAYLSGYWGRPVWDKPLVVLCNQNTASNGEIFTHAIKTLKRGKVVGVPTQGAVIATSDVALLDLGTMRLPHRGWFLPDGTDMELNGAKPDVLVWNEPQDFVTKRDRQLEVAIQTLKDEVTAAQQARPPVQLRYAK
jgi:tricorn protease